MNYLRGRRPLVLGATICLLFAAFVQSAAAQTSAVSIQNFAFQPAQINVPVGATVQWTNQDDYSHTVTSDSGTFGSGSLGHGGMYSFTFNQAGIFPYHCAIHPYMTGSVAVGSGPATNTPLPSSTPQPTITPSPMQLATLTPLPTVAPSPTATATFTVTFTSTSTATSTPSATSTATATDVPSPTATRATTLAGLRVSVSGKLRVGHRGVLGVAVKDTHAHPVKGAQVTVDPRGAGVSRVFKFKTNAHGAGRVALTPKHAGSIALTATKSGFATRKVKVIVAH